MRRLRIDFAPYSWWRLSAQLSPLGWLAACAGLLLCTSALLVGWRATQRYQRLGLELHHQQALHSVYTASHRPSQPQTIGASQADAVNAAIGQLNLPWRDVLDAIEVATPATIALVTLEPDAKKHQVQVEAEAKTGDEMIAYVEQLKHQPLFDEVVLTRHEVNVQDPNKPIRFQLYARWVENRQ